MDKDREILNKMNDKDYRTKVLDNLNGALGLALRVTAEDDRLTSIREYIWAIHSLQLENMQLEQIIEDTTNYNKDLVEIYKDCRGEMILSNAENNLILLRDKEYVDMLKEIDE